MRIIGMCSSCVYERSQAHFYLQLVAIQSTSRVYMASPEKCFANTPMSKIINTHVLMELHYCDPAKTIKR